MNKLFKSIAIIVAILFLFSPFTFATEVDFKEQIKSEEGSLFEKIIAECIRRNCTNCIKLCDF